MATYSNWREDLIEVIDAPTTDKKDSKKVKEANIKNKIVINPTFKEAVEEMGGEIIEMKEVDDEAETNKEVKQKATDEKAKKEVKAKQQRVGLAKKMILQKKMQAVRAGAGADITASYEPEGQVLENALTLLGKKKTKVERKPKKAMDAGARAKRMLARKVHAKYVSGSEDNVPDDIREAKVDKGRSDYGKASIRNYRRKGPGHGEPAMFDPENKRGKLIDKRREEHKARRGVKGAKVPAYKVNEGEDKAFNYVLDKIKKEVGKSGYISKNNPRKPQSAADKAKARAHQAKVDKENAEARAKDPSQGRYPKG
jgi:hypothetical protein